MEQYKDEELVDAFRDGNVEAFEELVLRHRNRVFNTIRNIIHDDELAWDGAQETFIKVYQKIDTYRGKCPIGAWIYRIAMNQGLNMLRKRKRIKEEVSFDETYMQGEKKDSPFESLAKEEFDNEDLSYAIEQLPKTQKAVVILRHFSQLSFKEIAETLNKNEDSVKSSHYYAIMKLRSKLVKDAAL